MSSATRLSSPLARMSPVRIAILAVVVCLTLYAVDLICLVAIPSEAHAYTANIAVPFDLMVCVPVAFYVLVIRPRKLTPLFVLPVIYAGSILAAQFTVPESPSLQPPLLIAAAVVDIVVVIREVPRLGRLFLQGFQTARTTSNQVFDWFADGFTAMLGNERAAHIAALELTMWYYTLASWRAQPSVAQGQRAFSYHKESGYVALSVVIMALFPVEAFAVHILVMQWSWIAATILTILTLYTLVWMIGNTRAVVLNPLLVDETTLTVRWGAYFCERVPLHLISHIETSEPDLPKHERVDLSVMGAAPCWIVLSEPLEIHTITGRLRSIRAINVSPDNRATFKKVLLDS